MQLPIWLAYILIYSSVHSISVTATTYKLIKRDWADFNIPAPYTTRVRNALKAEACSVRLSNLVGAGGSWYGFGKIIMDM